MNSASILVLRMSNSLYTFHFFAYPRANIFSIQEIDQFHINIYIYSLYIFFIYIYIYSAGPFTSARSASSRNSVAKHLLGVARHILCRPVPVVAVGAVTALLDNPALVALADLCHDVASDAHWSETVAGLPRRGRWAGGGLVS